MTLHYFIQFTLAMVFWEILRDIYLYLCNGQGSLHSFLQNKYDKLTPILLIHLFRPPHVSKSE